MTKGSLMKVESISEPLTCIKQYIIGLENHFFGLFESGGGFTQILQYVQVQTRFYHGSKL